MSLKPFFKPACVLVLVFLSFFFMGNSEKSSAESPILVLPSHPRDEKRVDVVTLKDFTKKEVRGAGFALSRDITVHIDAVGGGERSFWNEFTDDDESQQMYAAGWIINADTREKVWDMTTENTSGGSHHRSCEVDLALKKGSYEVYFMAYGYASVSGASHWSANVDRRRSHHSTDRIFGGLLDIFRGDSEERYDEFIHYARDVWGITLSVLPDDTSAVRAFDAPKKEEHVLISETRVGDNVVLKKALTVQRETEVHVYAIGEGSKGNDVDDFGWIVNADTRERVWDMNLKDVEYAGGARKNIKFDSNVTLHKGRYLLYYISDGSHSEDDWNSPPPFDPFNYGVTVSLLNEKDRDAIKVSDPRDETTKPIVELTEMRDNDYRSAGFALRGETKLWIYALGESVDDNTQMADYGWILDAATREKVWTMKAKDSYHAGGAEKNRLFDQLITLPKGTYIACFQTDGSHSYNNWNDDPPFDPRHWGLTIMGAGSDFDPQSVSVYKEDEGKDILAQLIRVGDDEHVHTTFSVERPTKVRIYALGEADGDEMADFGWIKNRKTGERVWEMEFDETSWAGGAKKNRLVDRTLTLDRGDYELHFQTDGSHAYNDWNDDPPDDRTHWGITIYAVK